MNAERWLPVVGYEGLYEVSDRGRVRGVDRVLSHGHRWKGRIIQPNKVSGGYIAAHLYKGDQRRARKIYQLVLEAFVGPCPEGMEACHFPDRDLANNSLANLRWDTKKANATDCDVHGTRRRGADSAVAKLNETDIERIFDLRRAGCTMKQIGAWLGICAQHVHAILRGKSWSHLGLAGGE